VRKSNFPLNGGMYQGFILSMKYRISGNIGEQKIGILAPENVGVILIWQMAICTACALI